MSKRTITTAGALRPHFTLVPLPCGACPSCGVDHGTQGRRCEECEAMRNSYPHTQFMKERGAK